MPSPRGWKGWGGRGPPAGPGAQAGARGGRSTARGRPGRRWRTRRGLLRSLLIYYGVPFKLRRLADLFRTFVKPGDLCFDVGAHVGDRTRALRRLGARVVAIEPQPACLDFLKWMCRNDKAVTVVAAGGGGGGGGGGAAGCG